jgi:hypothetical protein
MAEIELKAGTQAAMGELQHHGKTQKARRTGV